MNVTFSLGFEIDPDADELLYVEADEVLERLDEYRDYIEAFEIGYELGAITIKVNDQQITTIEDTLRYLVLGLCFQSVQPLLEDEVFTYQYFDEPTTVQLVSNEDQVYISGKGVESLACPRLELVEKLYECGMRYLAFVRTLDAQYELYTSSLVRDAEVAKKAIETARKGMTSNE